MPASETLTLACCVVGFGIKEFVRAFYFLVGGGVLVKSNQVVQNTLKNPRILFIGLFSPV